jgi:hypothetical protein
MKTKLHNFQVKVEVKHIKMHNGIREKGHKSRQRNFTKRWSGCFISQALDLIITRLEYFILFFTALIWFRGKKTLIIKLKLEFKLNLTLLLLHFKWKLFFFVWLKIKINLMMSFLDIWYLFVVIWRRNCGLKMNWVSLWSGLCSVGKLWDFWGFFGVDVESGFPVKALIFWSFFNGVSVFHLWRFYLNMGWHIWNLL